MAIMEDEMDSKVARVGTIAVIILAAITLGLSSWQRRRLLIWDERKSELLTFTRNAEPLIGALENYHKEHGSYPDRLEQLVPQYIAQLPVPSPELCRGSRTRGESWIYQVEPKNGECRALDLPYDLAFDVRLGFCRKCMVSFGDVFAYHPTGRYLREAHGGVLERIGKWGYYHE